eukprot:gene37126-2819_t
MPSQRLRQLCIGWGMDDTAAKDAGRDELLHWLAQQRNPAKSARTAPPAGGAGAAVALPFQRVIAGQLEAALRPHWEALPDGAN